LIESHEGNSDSHNITDACEFCVGELQRLEDGLRKFSCAVWSCVTRTSSAWYGPHISE